MPPKMTVGPVPLVLVCDEDQVQKHSARGFKLRQIVDSDFLTFSQESTTDNENGYNGQYGNRTHSIQKPVILRQPRFVMEQTGDTAIEERDHKIAALESELYGTKEALTKAAEDAAAAEKRFETKAAETAKLLKNLEDAKAQVEADRARAYKERDAIRSHERELEETVGKLQGAIGAIRMKEILEQV